jgi:molybdate-binding protein/DNA-binding XRE family transcriptional regulator
MAPGQDAAAGGGPDRLAASGARLRLARQARGFSQQQLAGMAGVSRQAVSAVEAGHSDPSLRVALALAHALGVTVEELFGPGVAPPPVAARPVAPLGPPGARVVLAPMGDSFVALPLAADTAAQGGFLPAGGVVAGPGVAGRRARPAGTAPAGTAPAGTAATGTAPAGTAAAGTAARGTAAAAGRAATARPRPGMDPGARPAGQPADLAVRPVGPPRPTLVIAGCDPALPLLETPLALLDPPVGFTWWACSSGEALRLADAGLVHVAGAHLRGRKGEYNTGPAAAGQRLRQGAEVIGFASWREGLVLRPGLAGEVTGLADVAKQGLRLVNREEGSEARHVLDREAARLGIVPQSLAGYRTRATGHLQVASAIAAGLADAGVASEPAALAYGLAFLPLTSERFDLVVPSGQADSREVQALRRVLSSPWLLTQLAGLPGYDSSRCGEHVAAWLPGRSVPEYRSE